MSFDTVLIANRGEIACRIMRTLRKMGLKSVAVYSDADCNTPHVKLADQAVHIGASPVGESYLNDAKIIEAARNFGAGAIHPGYGFLSENADFATACTEAGLVFIGPSPEAIRLMGDKAAAKRSMIKAGVPCVPGYQGETQDGATLINEAEKIGYPLMVKAAAGGGGRGMRLVENADNLREALSEARAEALSAFGSDILILERAIIRPRHVEIQVFGDSQGNIIHLGERDCSVQRRHQKVLEEAPCPIMTDNLRAKMGEAAVKAARSVDYVGAGTVEFMLDADNHFYFLEMNTRLQVEHPVTEIVTGLDLVALQIRVAQGQPLSLEQDDIQLYGHAIEARLYAEDPAQDFLPATGEIKHLSFPDAEGLRIDSGVESGGMVSPFYDPMIAKFIASGPDRDTARRRLVKALKDSVIFGVTTNRAFLINALNKHEFIDGHATTAFIGEQFSVSNLRPDPLSSQEAAIAAVVQFVAARDYTAAKIPSSLLGWMSASPIATPFAYDGLRIDVTPQGETSFDVRIEDASYELHLLEREAQNLTILCGGTRHVVRVFSSSPAQIYLSFGAREFFLTNEVMQRSNAAEAVGEGDIRAPMHGVLADVFVFQGDKVTKGTRLAVLEAMKMRHEILADINGTVDAIHAEAGHQIAADALIMDIQPSA